MFSFRFLALTTVDLHVRLFNESEIKNPILISKLYLESQIKIVFVLGSLLLLLVFSLLS